VPVSIFDLFTDPITPNQKAVGIYFDALRQSAGTSTSALNGARDRELKLSVIGTLSPASSPLAI